MPAHLRSRRFRIAIFAYGLACYACFFVVFNYLIAFLAGFLVPRTVDYGGTVVPLGEAILTNTLLVILFAVQHTIMARPAFKAWWTKVIPAPAERSTFVIATCGIFVLMFTLWRPMPAVVWEVENRFAVMLIYAVWGSGWLLAYYATFCIDHFDLFGLRQVTLCLLGRPYTSPGFASPKLYRAVRNPLMLGVLMGAWATPVMTEGHLLLASLLTGYILIGIRIEERDLLRHLGAGYARYRAETPMLLPLRWKRPLAGADEPDVRIDVTPAEGVVARTHTG